MLIEYPLNQNAEIEYARKWAHLRNPAYYNFDGIGGDCTNFVSQCLYAGGAVMNYTPDTGWYYSSPDNRSAAWTSVQYFYQFITKNKRVGPFGEEIPLSDIQVGDVIQLGGDGGFYHSLLVVYVNNGMPYVAAHTRDVFHIPLSSYVYDRIRCIHVIGARKWG